MRIIKGLCVREILDEIIVIPTGEASQVLSGVISLNEIGKFLFNLLLENQSEQSLVEAVLTTYDVDEETARADIVSFLEVLRRHKLLVEE